MLKYRIPHHVHPLKDEAWYEIEKERNTEDEFAREVLISYDFSVAGVVFKEFKDVHINRKPYQFNSTWQTLIGFDFGRTCASLFIQVDKYECLHVFKEIILTAQGTQDLAAVTKSYQSNLDSRGDFFYFCDPAGNSPDCRTKTTDVLILEDEGFRPMHFSKALSMEKRLQNGVQMIKKYLSERINGNERITVYEDGCPTLIEAFQSGYRYKENHQGETLETIDEIHPYEEVIDILRYALIERFTILLRKPSSSPGTIVPHAVDRLMRRA